MQVSWLESVWNFGAVHSTRGRCVGGAWGRPRCRYVCVVAPSRVQHPTRRNRVLSPAKQTCLTAWTWSQSRPAARQFMTRSRTERNGTVALPGLEGRPWADGQIVSSSDLGAEQRVRSVQGTDTAARRQPSRRFASHLQLPRCRGRASATDPVQPGKDRLQAPPSRHNGLRRRQPGRRGRTRATPPPNARGAGRPADLLRCGRADVPCDGHFVWRDREAMP